MPPVDRDLQDRRERETAAAMERAEDFEDLPPADFDRKYWGTVIGKDSAVIHRTLFEELNEAAEAWSAAETRFREVCRRIADGDFGPSEAQMRKAAAGKKRGRQAGPAEGGSSDGGTAVAPPDGTIHYKPKVQIKCRKRGGVILGARQKGPHFYPYKHENRVTNQTCLGKNIPGEVIVPEKE